MADFRNMNQNRGAPPPPMMRPIGPGPGAPIGPPGPPGPPMMPPGAMKQPVFPSLCPDFLKGVCSVFQCPKNHPEASLLFCQAYQRDLCQQGQGCSYMHATAEEEQYYKDTGLIPLRFMNKVIRIERGKGPLPNGQPSLFPSDNSAAVAPSTPTDSTHSSPFPSLEANNAPPPAPPQQQLPPDMPVMMGEKHKIKMEVDPPPPVKRQKVSYDELEVERNMLKEKVRILEKKVEQLDAANDVLLEKNSKNRGSSKRSPDRRRSPDKEDRRSRRTDRRDRDRSRDRSKERARSKETTEGNREGWKDGANRGGRWNNNDSYNNSGHNNYNNRQNMQ